MFTGGYPKGGDIFLGVRKHLCWFQFAEKPHVVDKTPQATHQEASLPLSENGDLLRFSGPHSRSMSPTPSGVSAPISVPKIYQPPPATDA